MVSRSNKGVLSLDFPLRRAGWFGASTSQQAFWWDELFGPGKRMTEHGLAANEGAALFGTRRAPVHPYEAFESFPLADPVSGARTVISSGGGWFTPDPQTCVCTPGSKATFGFVSQCKKGTWIPTGNQEFQCKADNINLHSTSFDWLVVSGQQAQFHGTGTINGTGAFESRVTVRDGDLIGQPDRFEIRILPAGSNTACAPGAPMGMTVDTPPPSPVSSPPCEGGGDLL
ncbi:hypothetical protein MELA_00693 [Candidatus Methylomirabilis lanthanidiphila]|uniref:Uncharacterized protein n=1 Tax=Candidatus Methylomirabilis lanthanidiphila TaxID=2211376 RepID=A0A564ZI42_9BACT|nr:hypothetical protein [Candidatus Methylomirabilis lanthanidiphila]VUZ84322.1 hypothetical protein MELA_00693 [Candidatus Methylomirabilis lanthanidiphila]